MQGPPIVLDVGPRVIRRRDGGDEPPAEMVAAAIDGIDDPVVLLDERPVQVDDLLRSLIAQALGGRCPDVVVVHPPDWPARRVARVRNATRVSADRVVSTPDGEPIDEIATAPVLHRIMLAPMVIGIVLALGCGLALLTHHRPAEVPSPAAAVTAVATVAEGRVTLEVPDGWTVERLTGGPGSNRVRVRSPADPEQALHITQSYVPGGTLAQAGAALGRAAAGHPEFTDFRADDVVAGRGAVTYREIRPGRVVRWVALLDGSTRISIGCQSRPGAEDGILMACEQAIRSARELGGTNRGG